MGLHSARHQGPTASRLILLWAAAMVDMGMSVGAMVATPTAVALQNPVQLFDTKGARMNVHDGDVRQWTPGGPFYYYGMCASTVVHTRRPTHRQALYYFAAAAAALQMI